MSENGKYLVILRKGYTIIHRNDTYQKAKDYIINNSMEDAWIAYLLAYTPPPSVVEDKKAILALDVLQGK